MKLKVHLISGLILMIVISGCNFKYSENGKKINIEKDGSDLTLAMKSLRFIAENKTDSLYALMNNDVYKKTKPEQFEWLFANGKRIINNNEYPNDSIITVSTITTKSNSKEKTFKEFDFPFINESNPDSTMYFKITIANGEIYKLILSTGVKLRKIN